MRLAKERELNRCEEKGVGGGVDEGAEMMVVGEDAGVANHVEGRRRDERDELCEELVGRHVDVEMLEGRRRAGSIHEGHASRAQAP